MKKAHDGIHGKLQKLGEGTALVATLKIHAKQKDLDKVIAIHGDILKGGLLDENVYIGSTLISVYIKCGAIAKAEEVFFSNLCLRDVISWNTIMSGYVQHGHGVATLHCFERIQCEALLPSSVTFVCVLKACGSTGESCLALAKQIHTKIAIERLQRTNVLVGTAMVDMYAKCGDLVKARQIFDDLSLVWDVASWNTIISAYAQHEYAEEAFKCFQSMQKHGFSPNAVTYVCILKACGSIGLADKGKEIHSEIVREGWLRTNTVLGTALVDMYGRCGKVENALEAFDQVRMHDVICWNVLIAGYVQHGYGERAVQGFHQIHLEGLFPNQVTCVYILNACGSIRSIHKGKEMHAIVTKQGFLERDIPVGNALVDMYAKCCAITEAQNVFDELQVQDVVAWSALIAGYMQHKQGDKALHCFEEMLREGVSPNTITLVSVLRACGSLHASKKGQEIHAYIIKEGLFDISVGNALIDMYAKCSMLTKALEVFDELPVQDLVSWNTIIQLYANGVYGQAALSCFDMMQLQGLSPDAFTFVSVVKACASEGELARGKQLHAEIMREGLGNDVLLGTALVDMYAKCGAVAKAQETFSQIPITDIVLSNTLIAGYVQHGYNEEALKCFERMHCEGVSPNALTYICVLKACGRLRDIEQGKVIHAKVVSEGLSQVSALVSNALLDMYPKCGELTKVQEVFDKLPVRDIVSWNTMIAGYVENEHDEEALNLFEQMQCEGFAPDDSTLLYALKACSNVGAIDKGKEIHADVIKTGLLEKDVLYGNALLDMYSKCGAPSKAQEVFAELKIRDIVSWTALMAGYAQVGKEDIVINIFNEMMRDGMEPDLITFTVVLNACTHSGLVDSGQLCFISMRLDYGIIPTLEHQTCMVDLFSRAGNIDKAMSMIMTMPVLDYLPMWISLLGACQRGQSVELGRLAFEHAMKLDDTYASAYVSMSNVYASAGT